MILPTASLRVGPDDGAAEPLLLLHPFTMSHHVWRAVGPQLADEFAVFAPTLPGHWGGPPLPARKVDVPHIADAVERMLDEQGWGTCHVAGNSLGGWTAFELARRGRARSVTAIAPAGGWAGRTVASVALGLGFLASWPAARFLAPFANDRAFLRSFYLRFVSGNLAMVSLEDTAHAMAAAYGCTGYLPLLWNALRTGHGVQGLDQVDCPVQLVLCGRDRVVPERWFARHFLDGLPDATVTRLPDVGHVPMLEAPDLIAETIRGFAQVAASPVQREVG
ncbi:alpha/beta fold hydrolase [Pseudonocardia sp. CA-107938]|uniref:alpha/beta fold hydrolase n=1 Tax=Pseudonocardia sp. CA-107938 TaxID=3240021 RepID=UPI003D8CDA8C